MSKYKNVVVPIRVTSGTNGNSVTVTTEAGFIRRAVIANGPIVNTGMVRASIEGNNAEKLAEMQAIEIFQRRNIGYSEDGVPINVQGGGQLTFKILATETFGADFIADLILVYEETNAC